jgi:predicted RNA-binding protein YlxR (DUF448 family)
LTNTANNQPRKRGVRTCIICGKQDDKRSLLRVVRSPEGVVEFDPSGRAAGRGAYVCSKECLAQARRGGRLARALKTTMSDKDYERVAAQMAAAYSEDDGEVKE